MAQKKPTNAAAAAPQAKKDPFADYKKAEEAVKPDGYWDPKAGPLHGVLVTAFEYIQKSGKSRGKPRVIYIFKLLSPTMATTDNGAQTAELQRGELCAVFDSTGLRALRELSGCAVALARFPEKTLLKNGNEMWEFDLRYKGERKTLNVRKSFVSAPEDADDVNDANDDPSQWAAAF